MDINKPSIVEQDDGQDRPAASQHLADAVASTDGRIMLGEDIEIYPSRPRPDLASPGTHAFEAKDRRTVGDQFAMLCGRSIVPRVTNIGSYKNLKSPNIIKLIEAGIVEWTPEGRQRFAFVFEKPPPKKLMQALDAKPHHFSEDRILSALIQPVLGVLADLRNIDLVHGAINPMNIYLSGAEGAETAMLGECITSAPSYRQHPLFEPVDRALAQPAARGPGALNDDLYAFGVCVAFAARGENVMAGKTEEEVIQAKLEEGAYGLMVGGTRLPAGISEFLRGVLNEDGTQRWTIDDALRWLEGRRLSTSQPRATLKAARPFIFREKKYWDLRSLTDAFSRNVGEAAVVIEHDQFDLWIKRNFEDKVFMKRLEAVWEREKASTKEKLVTGVCMALDPHAPVRYRGASVFPMGFGNALAEAMAKGEDIQVYAEIIQQQMFSNWINLRFEEISDAGGMLSAFEKCRNYLTQKIAGYGMERVLYTLNKECVCMSPLLKNYIVLNPGKILTALEDLARKGNRPDTVLDRHMIAFISVREPKMIDPFLGHITSHDRGNQVVGIIRALSAIQKRFNTGAVPAVTAWLASLSGPAIERFRDHDLRKVAAKQVERAASTGHLSALLDVVDDLRVVQDDSQRFLLAQHEYALLVREQAQIEGYLKQRRTFGYATGRQVAMLVSTLIASLCVLGYLAFYFMQRTP